MKKFVEFIIILISCLIMFSGASSLVSIISVLIILYTIIVFVFEVCKENGNIKIFIKSDYNKILILLLFFFVICFPMSYHKFSSAKYILFFGCLWLSSAFLKVDNAYYKKLMNAILFTSVLLAITIFLQIYMKNFIIVYLPFLLPLKEGSYFMMMSELNHNTYSGFVCERAFSATCLSLGIFVIYSNIISNKKINKFHMLLLGVLYLALFCTGKRMLLLINVLGLLFIFFINVSFNNIKKFVKLTFVLIIICSIVLINVPSTRRVFDRIFDDNSPNTVETRKENFWMHCIQMFKDKPILGYGVHTFIDYLQLTDSPEIYDAHNIYLQLLAENGIIRFYITYVVIYIVI